METYKVLFKEGETTGVYGISLVNDPAMESLWIALSKNEPLQLKAINTEKRIVCGAVLIPDKPIYRNQNGREFNIVFPTETIRLASEGFLKGGHQQSSTLEHDIDTKLSGVTIVESWIKESDTNDKSVMYGFNDPVGTWYASMKIDNPEIWNDYIKTGLVKGFSIDGFFDMEKVNLSENTSKEIEFINKMIPHHKMALDMVNEYIPFLKNKTLFKIADNILKTQSYEIKEMQSINLKSELNMSEQKKELTFKEMFREFLGLNKTEEAPEKVEVKLGSVNTADGSVKINFEGDTVAVGLAVTMTAPDGTELPLPDGDYSLEGGMNITVMGGLVSEVSTAQEEATDTEEAPMNPATPMSTAPTVKSEKHTQEVFYQLSKEDFATIMVELGNVIDTKINALKVELSKPEEVVELTKVKPAKEAVHPNSALQKFRESKLK